MAGFDAQSICQCEGYLRSNVIVFSHERLKSRFELFKGRNTSPLGMSQFKEALGIFFHVLMGFAASEEVTENV